MCVALELVDVQGTDRTKINSEKQVEKSQNEKEIRSVERHFRAYARRLLVCARDVQHSYIFLFVHCVRITYVRLFPDISTHI